MCMGHNLRRWARAVEPLDSVSCFSVSSLPWVLGFAHILAGLHCPRPNLTFPRLCNFTGTFVRQPLSSRKTEQQRPNGGMLRFAQQDSNVASFARTPEASGRGALINVFGRVNALRRGRQCRRRRADEMCSGRRPPAGGSRDSNLSPAQTISSPHGPRRPGSVLGGNGPAGAGARCRME